MFLNTTTILTTIGTMFLNTTTTGTMFPTVETSVSAIMATPTPLQTSVSAIMATPTPLVISVSAIMATPTTLETLFRVSAYQATQSAMQNATATYLAVAATSANPGNGKDFPFSNDCRAGGNSTDCFQLVLLWFAVTCGILAVAGFMYIVFSCFWACGAVRARKFKYARR